VGVRVDCVCDAAECGHVEYGHVSRAQVCDELAGEARRRVDAGAKERRTQVGDAERALA